MDDHRRATQLFAGLGLLLAVSAPACSTRSLRPIERGGGRVLFSCPNHNRPVYLVGDFNEWRPTQPMAPRNGHAEQELILTPGAYQYGCLEAGGHITSPPDAPAYVDDGFGGRNGLIVIRVAP